MAADDFAPATPDDDDLFDFPEVEAQAVDDVANDEPGEARAEAAAEQADELLAEVSRAAADLQDTLDGTDSDEAEDPLVASFPDGMLEDDDDDLFAFDNLLSDDSEVEMDASILDSEDRYGPTKDQEEPLEPEESPAEAQPADPPALVEEPQSELEDDFDLEEESEEAVSAFSEEGVDRDAEAEEFASLLAPIEEEEPVFEERAELTAEVPADELLEEPAVERAPRRAPRAERPSAPAVEEFELEPKASGGKLERLALAASGGRTFWLVAGSLLFLNIVVALLAVFAIFQVGSGLKGMNTSLAGSLRTIADDLQQASARTTPTKVGTPAAEQNVPQTPDSAQTDTNSTRLELEPRERTELRAARSEIEAGRFDVARKRLFRLLAVSDSPLSEEGRLAEAEANLLVAESFHAEAQAMIEARERLLEEEAGR